MGDEFIQNRALKINSSLQNIGAPFYVVCTRQNKKKKSQDTWRRVGQCSVPGFTNAYFVSEKDVSKYLTKHYGVSLSSLKNNPDITLKKIETKKEKALEKIQSKKKLTKTEQAVIKATKSEVKKAISTATKKDLTPAKITAVAKQTSQKVEKETKKVLPTQEAKNISKQVEKEVKKEMQNAQEKDLNAKTVERVAENIVQKVEQRIDFPTPAPATVQTSSEGGGDFAALMKMMEQQNANMESIKSRIRS